MREDNIHAGQEAKFYQAKLAHYVGPHLDYVARARIFQSCCYYAVDVIGRSASFVDGTCVYPTVHDDYMRKGRDDHYHHVGRARVSSNVLVRQRHEDSGGIPWGLRGGG